MSVNMLKVCGGDLICVYQSVPLSSFAPGRLVDVSCLWNHSKAGISLLLLVPVRVLASIVRPRQNWGLSSPHGAGMCCVWGRDGLRVSCPPSYPQLQASLFWGVGRGSHSMWDISSRFWPGFEPMTPVLEDGILTTRLLGKSLSLCYLVTWVALLKPYVSQSPLWQQSRQSLQTTPLFTGLRWKFKVTNFLKIDASRLPALPSHWTFPDMPDSQPRRQIPLRLEALL